MDSMTFTKASAAVIGAFLIFLLGKWAAAAMYDVGGHHGDEQAYVIEVDDGGEAEEEVAEVSIEEMLASADIGKGERVFNKCKACHKIEDGANGTGPHLYGVVGRDKGSVDGFGYSDTIAGMEGDWTPANLSGFLANPREYAPGTSMGFAGLKKIEDRANLIAYLDSIDD